MAKATSEGTVKVYWLTTVASKAAPTAANITAGVNLSPYLPTAGIDVTWTQNNASINMLDEGFTPEQIGTESAAIELTFVRHVATADDDAWELFDRGVSGYLVISRFGAAIAASRVEVYPATSHRAVPLAPAENEFQQAKVTLAVTDTPDLNAVVAA